MEVESPRQKKTFLFLVIVIGSRPVVIRPVVSASWGVIINIIGVVKRRGVVLVWFRTGHRA